MKQKRLTRRQTDRLLYCGGGIVFCLAFLGAVWMTGAAFHAVFVLLGVS